MTAKIPTADAPPELHEGVEVQLSNGLQATVAKVTDDHVLIDANHALAGKDLHFEVELVKLQKVLCLPYTCTIHPRQQFSLPQMLSAVSVSAGCAYAGTHVYTLRVTSCISCTK